jgi:hypothetical protein
MIMEAEITAARKPAPWRTDETHGRLRPPPSLRPLAALPPAADFLAVISRSDRERERERERSAVVRELIGSLASRADFLAVIRRRMDDTRPELPIFLLL